MINSKISDNSGQATAAMAGGAIAFFTLFMLGILGWLYFSQTSRYHHLAKALGASHARVDHDFLHWKTRLLGDYHGRKFQFSFDDRHAITLRSTLVLEFPCSVDASVTARHASQLRASANAIIQKLATMDGFQQLELRSGNAASADPYAHFEKLTDRRAEWMRSLQQPLEDQPHPGARLSLASAYIFDPRFFVDALSTLSALAEDANAQTELANYGTGEGPMPVSGVPATLPMTSYHR